MSHNQEKHLFIKQGINRKYFWNCKTSQISKSLRKIIGDLVDARLSIYDSIYNIFKPEWSQSHQKVFPMESN